MQLYRELRFISFKYCLHPHTQACNFIWCCLLGLLPYQWEGWNCTQKLRVLDNYAIFREGRKKRCVMGFSYPRGQGATEDECFWFAWVKKGVERKEQSGISSLFNRTSSGFCGEKSLESIYKANEQTACSYTVLPWKSPNPSLFPNVLWWAKLFVLKEEGLEN